MYESFFELTQRPFAAAPRVDRYFPGRSIEPARTAIERAIERAEGTSIVIGPAGCGKSLLLQTMAERFRGRFDVAMLSNGRLATRRALLQAILFELAMPYRGLEEGELRLALFDRLQPGVSQADGLLLLIDEAHLLPLRLLEEVRMITDFMRSGEPRVRLVLAGAAALEERLATPRLGSLQQRITARCYLEAMDRNDTAAYVRHQITSVGGEPKNVFTDTAIETIYRATEGIPRLVNQTCDHALVMACAGGVRPIDAAGIEEAWADLQQLPTPWSQAAGYTDPNAASQDSVIEFGLLDDAAPMEPAPKAAAPVTAATNIPAAPAIQASDLDGEFHDELADDELSGDHAYEVEAIAPIADPSIPSVRSNSESYAAVNPVERRSEADATLDALESHLADWETDYQPVATQQPEVELMLSEARRDPFAEDFVEEVSVVDRYASADRLQVAPRAQVYSTEGTVMAALLSASRSMHEQARANLATESKSAPTSVEGPSIKPSHVVDSSSPTPAAHASSRTAARQTIPLGSARRETGFAAEADPVEPEDFVIIPKRANSDADMIIVEDDPHTAGPTAEAIPVRKQDYRQLFTRMRKE